MAYLTQYINRRSDEKFIGQNTQGFVVFEEKSTINQYDCSVAAISSNMAQCNASPFFEICTIDGGELTDLGRLLGTLP